MQNMKPIVFTVQEADTLLGMIDVAVRAQGLRLAAMALLLTGKIQGAAPPVEDKKDD